MAHATSRPPKTFEDYLALPDDVRAELIGGEIYVTPAPTPRHQEILVELVIRLSPWARATGRGRVYPAPCDVLFPSGEVVQPNIAYVAAPHRGIVGGKRIEGVPDLIVEIVSPTHSERDRIVKRDLYARNGVPEYWLVDPVEEAVEVLRLEAGSYRPAGYFGRGSVLVTPSLPGFQLPVDEVFE